MKNALTAMKTRSVHLSLALGASALALLVGCSTPKPAAAPPAAVIDAFTASTTALSRPGEAVTLSWQTTNATSLSLEQVGAGPVTISEEASGNVSVTLSTDAVFLLTAVGAGGSDARFLSIKGPSGSGTGVLFTAVPAEVLGGQSTTLVWNAPQATTVSMSVKGGATVDLGGQTSTGSVRVTPTQNTTYVLTADGKDTEAAVVVKPNIIDFAYDGPPPAAGVPLKLKWTTAGGTQLVLTRLGNSTPLLTETSAAAIAQGEFTETLSGPLAPATVLTYQVDLTGPGGSASKLLRLDTGLNPRITQWEVPAFGAQGGTFNVAWGTANVARLEVRVDGKPVHVALTQEEIDSGNAVLSTPTAAAEVTLVAKGKTGIEVRRTSTVSPVGLVAFNSFTADKTNVAQGGEPVVLNWNVTNARHVAVQEVGAATVFEREGLGLETGSVTVYPNAASVKYRLLAHNGAGSQIAEQLVTVTVGAASGLSFQSLLPVGALTQVTGINVPGGTGVRGLAVVEKNAADAGFIDISDTGREVPMTSETAAVLVPLGRSFETRIYTTAVSSTSLSVSPNGWVVFSASAQTGPDNNTGPMKILPPLAVAPFWDDLTPGPHGRLYLEIRGFGPDAKLIVQWNRFALDGQPQSELTFQAQVGGDGQIVFAYGTLSATTTLSPTVGINDGTQTDALSPSSAVAMGDTWKFFGVATLPAPLRVRAQPTPLDVLMPQGVCRVSADARLPKGQFGITELNPLPKTGVVDGEWIEISNFSSTPMDLKDWSLDFGGTAGTYTFTSSVVLPANGRILLGQSATAGDGLTVNHVYGNTFSLADDEGTLSLEYQGTAYSTASWLAADLTEGTSVQLDSFSPAMLYAANVQALSCPGTAVYGTVGQRGTPGAANSKCFRYTLAALPNGNFESLIGTGTLISTDSSFDPGTPDTDEGLATLTLPQPVTFFGRTVTKLYVSTNGFLSTEPLTDSYLTNDSTPSDDPVASLAVFWDDLDIDSLADAGIYMARKDPTPAAGDEYTVISWEHYAQYGTGQDLNFQVKLFDSGVIEYHYGTMSSGAPAQGSSATVWLAEPTGKAALPVSVNSATAPGIAANSGWRFSPL